MNGGDGRKHRSADRRRRGQGRGRAADSRRRSTGLGCRGGRAAGLRQGIQSAGERYKSKCPHRKMSKGEGKHAAGRVDALEIKSNNPAVM